MSLTRIHRTRIVHALTAAIAAAGMATLIQPAQALRIGIGGGPVVVPAQPPLAAPAPDPDNTGKPEDPAGAMSRDPGDLMSSGTMVYVDDSFGSVDKLRTAIRYANQGQSQLAISTFQDIVTNYGSKLVLLNDNSYVSITDYVRERLLAMPAVKNGMYDQLFGLDARRDIDAAIENRDVATLIRVSDRYFPSTAALKGLAQAAEWYFERGEFSAAAQTWRKLLTHPLAGERKAEFLFRSALAEHLAEDGADAGKLRERLAKEYPDATGTLSGKEVKLLSKLDDLMAVPAWEKVTLTGDEWPAFEGGPSRSTLMNTTASIGAKLWSLPLSEGSDAASTDPNLTLQQARQQAALIRARNGNVSTDGSDVGALNSHPVLSNGALFVHLGNQIVAVSANAGAKLWAYPLMPGTDLATQQFIRNYGVNPRLTAHDSVSVFGDQVFAVVPMGGGGGTGSSASIRYNSDGMPSLPSRLVCLRREDGTEVWSRSSLEVKLEKEGSLTFIGSPIVTRQGVFVMARKSSDANFTPQYLVRLDRETGVASWACYLCSTSNMNNNGMSMIGNVPVPTLVDDVLYISTGQGADCAVDANVGRILWLRVVAKPNAAATGGGGGFINGPAVNQRALILQQQEDYSSNSPLLPSWKYNAPIILGDKMITTDSLVLRIYDRWNGKLIKAIKTADLIEPGKVSGTATLDVLAGAIGSKLVMSIKNAAVCFDIDALIGEKPQPEWVATVAGAGSPQGRPFLSSSGYYMPFTNKLVRVDAKTGKAEQWDWPKNDKDEPGKPGNLLVTSEQVVVVNDSEVAGYSKWEVARDNRLVKIKASPRDPAPYLDLAEISFRTNHQDLAQENMKQAVDLANAGAAPAGGGQSVGEMLGRLYRTNLAFAELLLEKGDTELRDQSRFYYEQCRASARTPEQGAEWRMRLSELSLKQKKYDEAALLYSEILADPALRAAGFREADGVQSASATAERHIKDLIKLSGPAVYTRFETQATALTQRAAAAKDVAGLQQVVDAYPNSTASVTAATTLAGLFLEKQDWDSARRVLWWLEPRVEGTAQAQAIAQLATASMGLKKYPSAAAWAARGARQYKDYSWTEAGKKVTFGDLKARVVSSGGADLEGRLPVLAKMADNTLKMEAAPFGTAIDEKGALGTQLLVPVETSAALRQPNLVFVRNGNQLHIRDTVKNEEVSPQVNLPNNADTVLVGATKDFAVLMQAGVAIGVDLKTHATWTQSLKAVAGGNRVPMPQANRNTMRINLNGGQVQVVNGNFVFNGNLIGPVDEITLIDETGNVVMPGAGSDPESVRRVAFNILGNAARFASARILNGNLLILAGNQIDAFNIETGKPAWTGAGGEVITARLPDGVATSFVGNEDMVVAQVDSPTGKTTTFCAFDAETGKPSKTVKLDNEHAFWRGLGDDGTLYVVTDQAVAAYDMVSEQNRALWRRTDVGSRFAGAAALTLDGLVAVNDNNDVMCLSLESGETRWQAGLGLDLLSSPTMASSLRSTVNGDLVVFQSNDGSIAFKSQLQATDPRKPQAAGDRSPQLAWIGARLIDSPPRLSLQASSDYLVEMMMGPINNRTSRSDVFVIREAGNGRTNLRTPISLNPNNTNEGPMIRSWQLVDGGIVFETITTSAAVNGANLPGKIYFWRTKQIP